MVADIRSEFYDILKKVDWMDEETRKNALDKARSMSTHIAYPDELLDDKKLEEFYADVSIIGDWSTISFLQLACRKRGCLVIALIDISALFLVMCRLVTTKLLE